MVRSPSREPARSPRVTSMSSGANEMATRKRSENEGTPSSVEFFGSLAEIGLRGVAQAVDMQYSALRALWETRARAAAAFGYPDYAGAFAGNDEDRVRQVMQA